MPTKHQGFPHNYTNTLLNIFKKENSVQKVITYWRRKLLYLRPESFQLLPNSAFVLETTFTYNG